MLVSEGDRVIAGQTLIKLECRSAEAEVRARVAQLDAAQAVFDRARDGSRPDEIAVGEAVVGYSQARADEAQKTLDRTEALKEGVTVTTAHILEVQRDARISTAQLAEANARLSLLRAGSREEDVRQSKALRDAAAAGVDASRARLDQCSIRAPVDGIVLDVLANQGQFLSLAVPQPLVHIVPDGQSRIRAEVQLHDLGHICNSQNAVVSSEAIPNATVHAQVASVSLAVSPRNLTTATEEAREKDTVAVVLNEERGGPSLPIGSTVMVRFDLCPSKT